MRLLPLLLALLLLVGCTSVSSRTLVGSQPYAITDAAALTGHWLVLANGSAQPAVIQVVDAPGGVVRFTYVQSPDAPSEAEPANVDKYPEVESCLVHLRKEGEQVVGNLHSMEEFSLADKTGKKEEADEYLWFLLTMGDKGHLVAILPDAERLGEMVEAKELRGTKKDGSVALDGLTPEEFAKVMADPKAFQYATPMMIVKLPAE